MYFIAVHAGAGYHGRERKEAAYTAAMRKALKAAARCLNQGMDSMKAVTAAISVLEDDPVTNAGYGSNLTMEGTVECDASIMCGDGTSGAVGAVPGVHNPIAAAHKLAVLSRTPLPCGLVRPVFLAGDGARRWAVSQGLAASASADEAGKALASPAAAEAWQNYMDILQQAQAAEAMTTQTHADQQRAEPDQSGQQQHARQQDEEPAQCTQQPPAKKARMQNTPQQPADDQRPQQHPQHQHHQQHHQEHAGAIANSVQHPQHRFADVCDTVGCIVVDGGGRVSAGVSSGGLAMKTPGRVGEAAVIGAGAWADDGQLGNVAGDRDSNSGCVQLPGVCVSVSGVGERIMAASLAKATAMQLQVDQEQQIDQIAQAVLTNNVLSQPGPWESGIIAARVTCSSDGNSAVSNSCVDSPRSRDAGDVEAAADSKAKAMGHPSGGQQFDEQQHTKQPNLQQPVAAAAKAGHFQKHLRVEFVAAFSSESFAVGYLTAGGGKSAAGPQVHILRRTPNQSRFSTLAAQPILGRCELASLRSGAVPVPSTVKSLVFSCAWPAEASDLP